LPNREPSERPESHSERKFWSIFPLLARKYGQSDHLGKFPLKIDFGGDNLQPIYSIAVFVSEQEAEDVTA
jgi:hypothetical protein